MFIFVLQMIEGGMEYEWPTSRRIWFVFLFAMCLASPPLTSAGTRLEDCDPEMMGFELVTGYVFTAPDDLLDSIPGTLMLTDCLEACQGNESCRSVNYETGLCVLFSSNADFYPGKKSHFGYDYLTSVRRRNRHSH